MAAAAALAGLLLVPETKYDRPIESFNGLGYGKPLPRVDDGIDRQDGKKAEDLQVENVESTGDRTLIQITQLTRPDIDNVNYKPRTWLSVLRPFQRKPESASIP